MRDSDACLILTDAHGIAASRGTALAQDLAARYGKPVLVVDVDAADAVKRAAAWLTALLAAHAGEAPFRLGIGGPRESDARGLWKGREVSLALLD